MKNAGIHWDFFTVFLVVPWQGLFRAAQKKMSVLTEHSLL